MGAVSQACIESFGPSEKLNLNLASGFDFVADLEVAVQGWKGLSFAFS